MQQMPMRRQVAAFRSRSRQMVAGVCVAALATPCLAQDTPSSGPLHDELAGMDSALFEAAFVTCDAGKFRSIFTDDAEFYHDKTGASFGEAVKVMKSCPRDNGVTRTLVPGSLEVYPMQGYGAVQVGRHVFAKKGEPGSEEAKFVHLWKREAGGWRLARVLSFDHRPYAPRAPGLGGEPRSSVQP
ncbi:MAG: nuclear transport factor 2 family protein [Roseateles sp.]|uniref:nuclear transport factor 2 family protein n=1 Tax=Roseateles sp. TaxID=1971397 RepID=UPI004036F177